MQTGAAGAAAGQGVVAGGAAPAEDAVAATSNLLIRMTQDLLDSISNRNFSTYQQLCDASLTAFEPEACGHLIHGLRFHRHYFVIKPKPGDAPPERVNVTIVNPHVRLCGADVGIVSYVRVVQRGFKTTRTEETRVWQRVDGKWVHVHFHRSAPGNTYG